MPFRSDKVAEGVRQRTSDETYRSLLRNALGRLLVLYFVPLLLLTIFFHLEYRIVAREAERRHRINLAEHQTALLEMFLGDRLLNLRGLTDNPGLLLEPNDPALSDALAQLKASSDAFVDLAVFDGNGRMLAYAGPLPQLADRSYGDEAWFRRLLTGGTSHVITDVYPGFREDPHYTMALKLEPSGRVRILRAVLSPQVAAARAESMDRGPEPPRGDGLLRGIATNLWLVTALFCGLGGLLVWLQARWVAAQQFAAMKTEQELNRQLVHAARLATVGEIAAGIAHEVNNPLAVISEKAGLIGDLADPRFGPGLTPETLRGHLDAIRGAVDRASQFTRRLLGFARPEEIRLAPCDIHAMVDEVLDDLLASVLMEAGARVERDFDRSLGRVVTDGDRMKQVVINLVKNAADALVDGGVVKVRTRKDGEWWILEVEDTGCGMSADQLERMFMPFFSTKARGAGTGLGLSISYAIVTGLGGRLTVKSERGSGSLFRIEMPEEKADQKGRGYRDGNAGGRRPAERR